MEKQETNSSKDIPTSSRQESDAVNPDESLKGADTAQQEADEKLPENPDVAGKQNAKEIDELVQGKNLNDKNRGGDATDTDEFKKAQDAFN